MAVGVIVVVLLSRLWFIAHREINIDEFEHAHASWAFAHGQVPYRDFFEHHTPWLYFAAAPTFAHVRVETNASAAISWLLGARAAMFALTVAIIALVYRLGVLWSDRFGAMIGATLLATSSQFLDVMLEFRPDVPALLCSVVALIFTIRAWRSTRRATAALLFAAGGGALGAALMFTQKYVFIGPGYGAALIVYLATSRTASERWSRVAGVAAFVVGVAVPIAVTAAWFAAHAALGPFVRYNFQENVRLNTYWFWPFPKIVDNFRHSPGLLIPGAAGFVQAARTLRTERNERTVLVATAASLFLGLGVMGRAYEQYFVMFFPHLAVFGGAFVERYANNVNRARVALAALTALVFLNFFTGFHSNARQLADLTYVTERTRPTDVTFAASAGPGVFRPHAWYYFFHSGPFATDREAADIASAIVGGRVRPRIVLLEDLEMPIPPAVWKYVTANYRQVSPLLWDRDVSGDRTNTAAKD
jgi:hypothetical protein